ncbi:uncharacterized protein LOC8060012 [Sorghum bicolor]|uniref:uncharacterized protein LOC8060012 n=1 Tax=Sorghum bicolor TaxID=4558 RepID=UPI0001A86963|nr:uncharacterized protein LOC8060012 [Sorghum bicolor]|eukprot:XP_002450597.1 uncharacterized protein LOC8060012 [Sorghum bicolor]
MEYNNSWMYGWSRIDEGFREEVVKFIEATEKHASTLTYNRNTIICPCKYCKNCMAFANVDTIESHLVMRGFIRDYTVWIHHGETMVVDDDNIDQELDVETSKYLPQYDNNEDMGYDFSNEQGGDFGNKEGADDVDGADTNGGAREGDEDDGDNLEDMLWAIGPVILLQKKGLENLERVKTTSKENVYDVEKGCPTHWTLLHFVLELLILKAKYG